MSRTTTVPTPKNLWPREVRWVHAGFAICIVWQLLSSLWMSPHWAKHADYGNLGKLLFSFHAWIGLLTTFFLLWQWGWIFTHSGIRKQMFPVTGPWQPIRRDLEGLLRGRAGGIGPHPGLGAVIHGLGLLAVTWMALTGTAVFFFLPPAGASPGPVLHVLIPLHKLLGNVVWAYLIGHIGMAALHALLRDRIWDIFRLLD